jgi:hypothetical protein
MGAIILASNNFQGEIPPSMAGWVWLTIIDLSNNNFTGNLNVLSTMQYLSTVNFSSSFRGRFIVDLHRIVVYLFLFCGSVARTTAVAAQKHTEILGLCRKRIAFLIAKIIQKK